MCMLSKLPDTNTPHPQLSFFETGLCHVALSGLELTQSETRLTLNLSILPLHLFFPHKHVLQDLSQSNSPCRPGWPQTQRDLPASAYQGLE